MGSAYNTLKAEKIQFVAELDAAMLALAGLKGVLAEREKSLEESREANKALVAEMEKMGKQRTELMGQMKVMNRRCISQEKYVSDWARKMIALLGGKFCFSECFLTVYFTLCLFLLVLCVQIFAWTLRLRQLMLSGRFFRTFHSARTPIETCSERTFAWAKWDLSLVD